MIISFLKRLLIILLPISLGWAPLSYAETPVGQVIWVNGSMTASMGGRSPRSLHRRSPLYVNDVLVTAAGASGGIGFTDGTAITLRPLTTFKVDDYQFSRTGSGQDKSVMTLLKGGFRTITGVISKQNPENYQMKTPVATIGVRGTDYTAALDPRTGALSVKIDKGKIAITNSQGTVTLDKSSGPLYGSVASENSAPIILNTMPAILSGAWPMVTLTPRSSSYGGGSSGGDAKSVSSFCVD